MKNGLNMGEAEIQALRDFTAREVPLGYMAEPAEIAAAGLFLASQDASYINGIELTVDGGLEQI